MRMATFHLSLEHHRGEVHLDLFVRVPGHIRCDLALLTRGGELAVPVEVDMAGFPEDDRGLVGALEAHVANVHDTVY